MNDSETQFDSQLVGFELVEGIFELPSEGCVVVVVVVAAVAGVCSVAPKPRPCGP